jgi:hypothetical protein
MQVVLPSGDILEANESSHANLFRSIKGGGNNFGIVTRVDIATLDQDSFCGGAIMCPYETKMAHLDAFTALKLGDYEPLAQVEQSLLYSGPMKAYFISNNCWFLRPTDIPPAFKRFQDIKPQTMNTMRIDTQRGFAQELHQSMSTYIANGKR